MPKKPQNIRRFWLASVVVVFGYILQIAPVSAVNTVPLKHIYGAHLLNASGNPITSAHVIRLSYWKNEDLIVGDITGGGAINTSAGNYAGWQEVQTFTPNSQGYFTVEMGKVTSLPDFTTMSTATLLALKLQVEVKAVGAPDTSYEVLDPEPLDSAIDRSPVNSVPTAINSDLLDQREIGTASGSIAILDATGKFPIALIPSGVNGNNFTIDSGGTAPGNIVLTFGQAINKTLLFNQTLGRFEFNDDLYVQGNLQVTGLINGVDITTLSQAQLSVTAGAGLAVNISAGSYRLNSVQTNFAGQTGVPLTANATNYVYFTSGGLQVNASGFPTSGAFVAIAQVTTNATNVVTISDRRATLTNDTEKNTQHTLHPQYTGAAYVGDGTDNVGQLRVDNDSVAQRNSYVWLTTKGTLQDYDIVIPFTIPQKFAGWQSAPLSVSYYTTTGLSTQNKLDIIVTDTAGAPVTLIGGATDLASASWTTANITFGGSPTWTPGGRAQIRLRTSSLTPFQVHLGDLHLLYKESLQ